MIAKSALDQLTGVARMIAKSALDQLTGVARMIAKSALDQLTGVARMIAKSALDQLIGVARTIAKSALDQLTGVARTIAKSALDQLTESHARLKRTPPLRQWLMLKRRQQARPLSRTPHMLSTLHRLRRHLPRAAAGVRDASSTKSCTRW